MTSKELKVKLDVEIRRMKHWLEQLELRREQVLEMLEKLEGMERGLKETIDDDLR